MQAPLFKRILLLACLAVVEANDDPICLMQLSQGVTRRKPIGDHIAAALTQSHKFTKMHKASPREDDDVSMCKPTADDKLQSFGTQPARYPPMPMKLALHERRRAELESLGNSSGGFLVLADDDPALSRHRDPELKEPLGLLVYGDSIPEQWRESCIGEICPPEGAMGGAIIQNVTSNRENFKTVFEDHLGHSAIMAVGGDTTADLLWRLQNGEAPRRKPTAILVHIGVNDINERGGIRYLNPVASGIQWPVDFSKTTISGEHISEKDAEDIASEVSLGIESVVREILKNCDTPVILSSIFPTGSKWPAGPYGQIIPKVNGKLGDLAKNTEFGKLIHADCGRAMVESKSNKIDPKMMPDFLHPSPVGMARWAECISQAMYGFVKDHRYMSIPAMPSVPS